MEFDDVADFPVLLGNFLGYSFLAAIVGILARDIGWYFLNLPTRDQTKATKDCYDLFERLLPETNGIDYSEGFFDFKNKPLMSLQDATVAKYTYIATKLGLKAGMTLLDAGCGNGVWMNFCRGMGVNAIGLTLSPEQAKTVRAKGLNVEVRDYRKENPAFIGKFDRITALGSTEHVCSSMGALANNAARERSIETLTDIWTLFQRYLKPDGKIFITVLTFNEKVTWSLMDRFQMYVLDQHYGGYYPRMSDIQFKIAPAAGLTVSDIQDQTASYHWSSMIEPKHFGYYTINWRENTWDKVSAHLRSLFKSPLQFPFHILYQALDTWMAQFCGPQKTPLTDKQVAKALMQLKCFMLSPISTPTVGSENRSLDDAKRHPGLTKSR